MAITTYPRRAVATVVVTVSLTGAPEQKTTYTSRTIAPDTAVIRYLYEQQVTPDGWTEHSWLATDVQATGPRVLKPAADGSQRLGVDRHEARWYTVRSGRDVAADNPDMPEWLAGVIEQMRPSGGLDLPQVAAP
jgi:hypothetical protein